VRELKGGGGRWSGGGREWGGGEGRGLGGIGEEGGDEGRCEGGGRAWIGGGDDLVVSPRGVEEVGGQGEGGARAHWVGRKGRKIGRQRKQRREVGSIWVLKDGGGVQEDCCESERRGGERREKRAWVGG